MSIQSDLMNEALEEKLNKKLYALRLKETDKDWSSLTGYQQGAIEGQIKLLNELILEINY